MRLNTYKAVIKDLLTDYPRLRGNDRRLYLAVLWKMGYPLDVSIRDFFNDDSFPNYESIRRCRQKTQEENPELLPDKETQEARRLAEEEYLEFARN